MANRGLGNYLTDYVIRTFSFPEFKSSIIYAKFPYLRPNFVRLLQKLHDSCRITWLLVIVLQSLSNENYALALFLVNVITIFLLVTRKLNVFKYLAYLNSVQQAIHTQVIRLHNYQLLVIVLSTVIQLNTSSNGSYAEAKECQRPEYVYYYLAEKHTHTYSRIARHTLEDLLMQHSYCTARSRLGLNLENRCKRST